MKNVQMVRATTVISLEMIDIIEVAPLVVWEMEAMMKNLWIKMRLNNLQSVNVGDFLK